MVIGRLVCIVVVALFGAVLMSQPAVPSNIDVALTQLRDMAEVAVDAKMKCSKSADVLYKSQPCLRWDEFFQKMYPVVYAQEAVKRQLPSSYVCTAADSKLYDTGTYGGMNRQKCALKN